MKNFKGMVVEGGGARGIVFGGAIKMMSKKGLLSTIDHYVGTSVGSITVLMLTLGYTATEINDKMVKLKSNNILKKDFIFYMSEVFNPKTKMDILKSLLAAFTIGLVRVPINIFHLFYSFGYFDNEPLRKWVRDLLEEKDFKEDVSFTTLYEKTGKKLYITTTNVDKRDVEVFSHSNDKVSVLDAVMMSVSIPIFFRFTESDNDKYCDGGIIANYNINYLSDNGIVDAKDIIGLRVDSSDSIDARVDKLLFKKDKSTYNLKRYINNLIELLYEGANSPNLRGEYEQTTITLKDYGIGVVDFSMSEEDKQYYSDLSMGDFLKQYDNIE